jgi:hypothetical protein
MSASDEEVGMGAVFKFVGITLGTIVGVMTAIILTSALVNSVQQPNISTQSNASRSKARTTELDESRPVFTNDDALFCPASILFDPRESRSGLKLAEASSSLWGKAEKAKELGCDLLRGGLRLHNTSFTSGIIVRFSLEDDRDPTLLTFSPTCAVGGGI